MSALVRTPLLRMPVTSRAPALMYSSADANGPWRQDPGLYFGPEPAHVVLKSSGKSASLRDLVESRCTSLSTKFRPAWWLLNGHGQTLYSVLGNFSKIDQVDGGTLGLDFTPPDASTVRDDAPIIVVQHGLTGGSHEAYVRAILAPACAPVEQGGLGYRAVVVNFRGCVPLTSAKFYTAAQTDDLRQALIYISKLYPKAPLLGLGFSMGGNILIRYLAEEGVNSRLSSACILGCPWDLQTNNERLLHSTLGRRLYLRGMGGNVMTLMRQHSDTFLEDPDHPAAKAMPHFLRLRQPTLTDFDDLFTRSVGDVATPFPFSSVRDYYTWASSHKVAENIKVPCLTINAKDDPVVQGFQRFSGENGYIVTVLTGSGGHLGWYKSRRKRWTTKPVMEWMELVGKDLVLDPIEISSSIDGSGYLRDAQWPNLGCKEVPGGGLIDGNRLGRDLFRGL
ncbi:Alpha/Beta hydrolase protein [Mycena rosella]|uniref:Alpha/Beta hydrolase protein n=1 Tax=Mycena rosella TaxID=1033263 RepID=A0AAD7MA20_MYCRO|nr:Alpha/Beta hydrolase protein [Mycena rosella]